MSAGGDGHGSKVVVAALLSNAAIAVAKFVGFLVTGSSAMLAESVHSVADSGNQGLLLLGRDRAEKEADAQHPFGYGRERYFWAFVVALVLFSLGGLFSLYEGYHKLQEASEGGELTSPAVAIGILMFAIVAEGFSFRTAVLESKKVKGEQSWWRFVRTSKSPELPIVLLEDFGALIGLSLAVVGVALSAVTGDLVWDALGTMAIGSLLLVIAVFLVIEMKALLIGESATATQVREIRAALVDGAAITGIIHLKTTHLGPDELLVAAKIVLAPGLSVADVANAIDAAESRARAAVPIARVIYLEPDLYRTPA
ncbi:MAG: cation diffusion facilitator family transporter [Mycobacteriales bacterium]